MDRYVATASHIASYLVCLQLANWKAIFADILLLDLFLNTASFGLGLSPLKNVNQFSAINLTILLIIATHVSTYNLFIFTLSCSIYYPIAVPNVPAVPHVPAIPHVPALPHVPAVPIFSSILFHDSYMKKSPKIGYIWNRTKTLLRTTAQPFLEV